MELMLIRHGRSLGDDEDRIERGGWDVPLTRVGIKQARLLAARLHRESYRPHILYVSPLQRARRVAQMVAEKLKMKVTLDDRLREQHTACIGGLTHAEAEQVHPEPEGGPRSHLRCPAGESMIDHIGRVIHFYAEILDRHLDDSVCIVAHGLTLSLMLSTIYGLPPRSPFVYRERHSCRTGDAGIHRLTIGGAHESFTHCLNDTSHLKGSKYDPDDPEFGAMLAT